jgi:polysaccharide biosynthesis/export protein VpsN
MLKIFTSNFCISRYCMAVLLLFMQSSLLAQNAIYLLGPGDLISISVYEEADLSFAELRIGDTGLINYPFLGEVDVVGKTSSQLEQQLRQGLIQGEYLINPTVTVTIVQYRPFYINGEVAQPGSYPYEPGLTLRKAISIAGGFTERANRNRFTIHHGDDSTNPDPDFATSLDLAINPGDIITIGERFF